MKDVDSEMELRDAFRVLDNDGAPEPPPVACIARLCWSRSRAAVCQRQPCTRAAARVAPRSAPTRPIAGLGYITCKEMTTICKVLGEDLDEIEVRPRPPDRANILPVSRRAAHSRARVPTTRRFMTWCLRPSPISTARSTTTASSRSFSPIEHTGPHLAVAARLAVQPFPVSRRGVVS